MLPKSTLQIRKEGSRVNRALILWVVGALTLLAQPDASTVNDRVRHLIAERSFEQEQLDLHRRMLSSSSFAQRTDLFCRDDADSSLANGEPSFSGGKTNPFGPVDLEAELERKLLETRQVQTRQRLPNPIPRGPFGLTVADLRNAYNRLLNDKPPTREGEALRQQTMFAIRETLTDYNKEFEACRVAVTYAEAPGTPRTLLPPAKPFPLPTNDQLRDFIKQELKRIEDIDSELKSPR